MTTACSGPPGLVRGQVASLISRSRPEYRRSGVRFLGVHRRHATGVISGICRPNTATRPRSPPRADRTMAPPAVGLARPLRLPRPPPRLCSRLRTRTHMQGRIPHALATTPPNASYHPPPSHPHPEHPAPPPNSSASASTAASPWAPPPASAPAATSTPAPIGDKPSPTTSGHSKPSSGPSPPPRHRRLHRPRPQTHINHLHNEASETSRG